MEDDREEAKRRRGHRKSMYKCVDKWQIKRPFNGRYYVNNGCYSCKINSSTRNITYNLLLIAQNKTSKGNN